MPSLSQRHYGVAAVLLVHDQPKSALRLMQAIAPIQCFVHVDANAQEETYRMIAAELPNTAQLLPRIGAGWAHPGVLQAEVAGYRTVLLQTMAEHVILLTGSDYPLVPTNAIIRFLGGHPGLSFVRLFAVPHRGWGWTGGLDRFLVRHAVHDRHRVRRGLRRLPSGVRPAGGSGSKVLARRHVQAVLDAIDARPDVWAFFQEAWTPDETCIPSILNSPKLGGTYPDGFEETLFHIDWTFGGPNPKIFTEDDLRSLSVLTGLPRPRLFARKFGPDHAALDVIDRELRNQE